MELVKVCAFALMGVLLALQFKGGKQEYGIYLGAALAVVVFSCTLSYMGQAKKQLMGLWQQLSGGQKQRVAIARALATNPRYLLCDEATSALDPNTTRSILELLREINKSLGVTIIVITHEMKVIDQICDRVAVIDKSCIAEEGRVADVFTNPKSDIARELVLPQERPVLDPTTGGAILRLIEPTAGEVIFNGEDTQKPVISEMILACRVPVNVLFADTKSVEGAAYGHMILELPNDEHDAEKVVSWLKNSGLTWKEER